MGWIEDAAQRDPGAQAISQGSTGMGFAAPLIGAGATLGGAVLGNKGQNKAMKAQAAASDKALAFTREQEATRKAVYDQKMAQYTAMRNVLAQRYGIDLTSLAGATPGMSAGPAAPMAARPVTTQPAPAGPPMAPGNPLPAGASVADLIRARGGMEGWNDWGRQGIPQA